MEQGLPGAVPHASQTSDTSGDETDVSEPRRRVRRKESFKMKKVWGASELGRFFVTGPTHASGKPSHFYCRLCRKDVSVLIHGMHEILRHYQGTKHFPRDQRLRLGTPGWRVLDFEGKVMKDEDVARQRDRILRGLQVVRDRDYPFQKISLLTIVGQLTQVSPFWPRSLLWSRFCVWGELRTGASAMVPVYSGCQSSERRRHVIAG